MVFVNKKLCMIRGVINSLVLSAPKYSSASTLVVTGTAHCAPSEPPGFEDVRLARKSCLELEDRYATVALTRHDYRAANFLVSWRCVTI